MAGQTDASKLFAQAHASQRLAERTADGVAAFLLPHLKSRMSLLDVGCGPGSITLGLAARVTPGQVIGIDIEAAQVERATNLALEHGVTNARFQVGNAYDLPLAAGSVDVVFAHTLFVYLHEPLRALREFRRVLKRGGLVAIQESDSTTIVIEPSCPALEAVYSLSYRVRNTQMSNARRLRTFVLEAGFAQVESFAFAQTANTAFVNFLESGLRSPAFRRAVTEHGWATEPELEDILTKTRAWAQRPDAFAAWFGFAVLGWLEGDGA